MGGSFLTDSSHRVSSLIIIKTEDSWTYYLSSAIHPPYKSIYDYLIKQSIMKVWMSLVISVALIVFS